MDQDTTTFTVITQSTDPATHEGWPYPDKHTTSLVGGTLAQRVQRRFGELPGTPVMLDETEISCGYSEYTQDTRYEFTVRCGRSAHDFSQYSGNALVGLLEWLDEGADEQELSSLLEDLPVGSMIRCTFRDGSQEPYVAVRCESGEGAATGKFGFLGGRHWLGIADWGVDVEVLYRAEER